MSKFVVNFTGVAYNISKSLGSKNVCIHYQYLQGLSSTEVTFLCLLEEEAGKPAKLNVLFTPTFKAKFIAHVHF